MTKKEDQAEHAQKEEADHLLITGTRGKSEEKSPAESSTAKGDGQADVNQKLSLLEQEISREFASPRFNLLMNDPKFRGQFKGTCAYHFARSHPPAGYTLDDFEQDMIFHFVRALMRHRDEASLGTVLFKAARNWRIDLSRRKRCPSIEELMLGDEDGRTFEGADFEGGAAGMRYGDTYRNGVAEDAESAVLAHELMDKLSDEEKSVFYGYKVERKTMQELAADLNITRQAVAGRLERIYQKLGAFAQEGADKAHPTVAR